VKNGIFAHSLVFPLLYPDYSLPNTVKVTASVFDRLSFILCVSLTPVGTIAALSRQGFNLYFGYFHKIGRRCGNPPAEGRFDVCKDI
jgi:hypothetical protein